MRRARLVVLLAVLAGMVAFVAPLDDGRPLFSFAGVKAKVLGFRRSAAAGEAGSGVYKWKGDDGTWHYSNVRPEGRDGVQRVKGEITWVKGPGGRSGDAATGGADPGRPRNAAELLAESRRLSETTGARETELEALMREARQ